MALFLGGMFIGMLIGLAIGAVWFVKNDIKIKTIDDEKTLELLKVLDLAEENNNGS